MCGIFKVFIFLAMTMVIVGWNVVVVGVLGWWFGKCSFACLGRHFPKDVACLLFYIVYVIQKPLMGPIRVNYCYVNLSFYVRWKKPLTSSQVGNIILFCQLCELKKNHLWAHKCVISFPFHCCISWKTICGLTNV